MRNIENIASMIGELNHEEIDKLTELLLVEHDINATMYRFSVNTGNYQSTSYDLVLRETGQTRLRLLKEIKEIFGLGLREAKDIIDSAPCYIKKGLSRQDAERIKIELEIFGATIEIK